MYTEIYFRAELVKDVPEDVLDVLRYLVTPVFPEPEIKLDHELFRSPRWYMLGQGGSGYFPEHPESSLTMSEWSKRWVLFLNADLKNYDGEIGKFFDWIDPYVHGSQGQFVGYSLYEEDNDPTIFHKKSSNWS
jgi:hypothetical protein